MTFTRRKLLIVVGVVSVFAVIGAIVAVVLWQTGDSASDSNTSSSNNNNSTSDSTGNSGTTSPPSTYVPGNVSTGSTGSASFEEPESSITSDPSKATYTLSAYAVGDWGTTIARESCCKRRVGYEPTNVDKNAQDVVAAVMGKAAAETDLKPKVVMGQGDNFYWVGIIDKVDQAYRFDKTFESKFNAESLSGIPWVNVMGNHDMGGSSFICAEGGTYVPCTSAAQMVQALKDKFTLQAEYKSPNSDRWIMKDHFYVHSIEDEASGVSIDIFNLDTNDADVHGAQQICCQCYGYSKGENKKCNEIVPGHPHCAGGDVGMFSACMEVLKEWGEDSRRQLKEKVAASKATWKIVNTHYNPYNHYAEARIDMWWELLKDSGIQLWINGHTHGEKHDFAKIGMHFIENGAGGGILNEAGSPVPEYARDMVQQLWSYPIHEYGFFEIKASKEWIKASFITYDGTWNVADDFTQSSIGGVAAKYCWYIPVDGTKGKAC